jgi:hypothetical protein
LLSYYITKTNKKGETPAQLLRVNGSGGNNVLNGDFNSKYVKGTFGAVKNATRKLRSITATLGRLGSDKDIYIENILKLYSQNAPRPGDGSSGGLGDGQGQEQQQQQPAAAAAAAAAEEQQQREQQREQQQQQQQQQQPATTAAAE